MGWFPLDLSKFKKVSSDKQATTLRHSDGHEVKIAHNAVSPRMRGKLHELPTHQAETKAKSDKKVEGGKAPQKKPVMMADGGNVADKRSASVNLGTPSIPEQFSSGYLPPNPDDMPYGASSEPTPGNVVGMQTLPEQAPIPAPKVETAPQPVVQTPETSPQAQSGQTPQPQQIPGMGNDPYGTMAQGNAFAQGLGEAKAGMAQEAAATGALGTAQAAKLQQGIDAQTQMQNEFKTNSAALQTEIGHAIDDIRNHHINPSHYFQSQDTGQKVMTTIGLILGGIGGMGRGNVAMDFLNKQIDRDIEAQKTNLGKKESVLNAYYKQFGNLRDATDMTRILQTSIIADQMKQEAAKQADPIARSRMLQEAGKLDMQVAPQMGQIAMRQSLLSGANKGSIPPERVILAIVPANEQAGATKELKEAQGMVKSRDNILSAFDQISDIQSPLNRMVNPMQSKAQIDAITGPLTAQLSKETAGRFTEQDAHMLSPLWPTMTDNAQTQRIKRQKINALVSEKMNFPELKKWGIDISGTGRYDSTGTSKFQPKPIKIK